MTEAEKTELASELSRVVAKFLNDDRITTNQEAVEVVGIATMYYHCLLYRAHEVHRKQKA